MLAQREFVLGVAWKIARPCTAVRTRAGGLSLARNDNSRTAETTAEICSDVSSAIHGQAELFRRNLFRNRETALLIPEILPGFQQMNGERVMDAGLHVFGLQSLLQLVTLGPAQRIDVEHVAARTAFPRA